MKEVLDELESSPRQGAGRGRGRPHRGAACPRQAHRARAARPPARRGLLRGVRHVCRAPLHRFRHGEDARARRRRGDRLGHHQRPRHLRVRQGFHRIRRLAIAGACREDGEDSGHGAQEPRADHRPVRCRRGAHPGRRGGARRLRRGVLAQRARLGRDPANLADHGAVRGRRRLFAGHDRLHLHGERHLLHVRHRPRRGEDRDQGGGDRGAVGRRGRPHDEVVDRRRRLRKRCRGAAPDAAADGFSSLEQSLRRARASHPRPVGPHGEVARHADPQQSKQALRHEGADP